MRGSYTASTLGAAAAVATVVVLLGTRDLESYEHAFFSLDRGTAARAIEVLGHPVYTLSIGLGVRLPLQGSFGASPAAVAAPFVPAPVAYWLLLAFSVAATLLVVRHALEPLCGRLITWCAAIAVFCSVPMATYAVVNDWPDVTFTYQAVIVGAFAPHALAEILRAASDGRMRAIGALSVAGITWGAVALAHPGYWPHIAATLVCGGVALLVRPEYSQRTKAAVLGVLAAAAVIPVLAQAPDIFRELNIPGADARSIGRYTEPPEGSLIAANLFPFGEIGSRLPFSQLLLAVVALAVGVTVGEARRRRLIVGAAILSVGLAIAAVAIPASSSAYAPTSIWTLRDSAAVCAILAAAVAAGTLGRCTGWHRTVAVGALCLAALQGPAYAAYLAFPEPSVAPGTLAWPNQGVWTRDMTSPEDRLRLRGMPPAPRSNPNRLALFPGVRGAMRTERMPSTDFADAGFTLVTAWTKQRTMRHLLRPNELLFNQGVNLSAHVLCDTPTVGFLQLRYLVAPPGAICQGWSKVAGTVVDGRFDLLVPARLHDLRVRALPVRALSDALRLEPALSDNSMLISVLEPIAGSTLTIGRERVSIHLRHEPAAPKVLLLPIAFDPAWRTSHGTLEPVGGLLALMNVSDHNVDLTFVPDATARLRGAALAAAQIASLLGFCGLAIAGRRILRPAASNER